MINGESTLCEAHFLHIRNSAMKRLVASTLILGSIFCGLAGCDTNKTTTSRETKITTPNGETTVTTQTEVKKTGENPPPARNVNP
jgi:hypothetical protein